MSNFIKGEVVLGYRRIIWGDDSVQNSTLNESFLYFDKLVSASYLLYLAEYIYRHKSVPVFYHTSNRRSNFFPKILMPESQELLITRFWHHVESQRVRTFNSKRLKGMGIIFKCNYFAHEILHRGWSQRIGIVRHFIPTKVHSEFASRECVDALQHKTHMRQWLDADDYVLDGYSVLLEHFVLMKFSCKWITKFYNRRTFDLEDAFEYYFFFFINPQCMIFTVLTLWNHRRVVRSCKFTAPKCFLNAYSVGLDDHTPDDSDYIFYGEEKCRLLLTAPNSYTPLLTTGLNASLQGLAGKDSETSYFRPMQYRYKSFFPWDYSWYDSLQYKTYWIEPMLIPSYNIGVNDKYNSFMPFSLRPIVLSKWIGRDLFYAHKDVMAMDILFDTWQAYTIYDGITEFNNWGSFGQKVVYKFNKKHRFIRARCPKLPLSLEWIKQNCYRILILRKTVVSVLKELALNQYS